MPVSFHAPMVWLVDNRIVDRQPGYDVVIAVEDLTDLRAAGSSGAAPRAALVNLGWIAATGGRDTLPLAAIPARLRVQGIFRTEVTGLLLGANVEDHGRWPMRIQQADPVQMAGAAVGTDQQILLTDEIAKTVLTGDLATEDDHDAVANRYQVIWHVRRTQRAAERSSTRAAAGSGLA